MTELPATRRIVTAHSDDGKATVRSDESIPAQSIPGQDGLKVALTWITESVPSQDNNASIDGASRTLTGDLGLVSPNGTNCQLTELGPGVTTLWHRTSSIDHNILIEGTLILMLDDGTEKVLDKPGDVVIQRGTMHAWRNPGPGWTRWACVVVGAEPASVNGKVLPGEAKLESA